MGNKRLIDGGCQPLFQAANGIGYKMMFTLQPEQNVSVGFEYFKFVFEQYSDYLSTWVEEIALRSRIGDADLSAGVYIDPMEMNAVMKKVGGAGELLDVEVPPINVSMKIVVKYRLNITLLEEALVQHLTHSWHYIDETTSLQYTACPRAFADHNQYANVSTDATLNIHADTPHVETTEAESTVTHSLMTRRKFYTESLVIQTSAEKIYTVSKLLACPMIKLNSSEFRMVNSEKIVIASTEMILGPDRFAVNRDGSADVCVSDAVSTTISTSPTYDEIDGYISLVLTCISLACLSITFIVYCLFEPLRTIPGKLNMGLVVSLIFAQGTFQFGVGQTENRDACVVIGIVIHFLWICAFCWMNVCSLHMARVFFRMKNFRRPSDWTNTSLIAYTAYTLCVPACVVAATITYSSMANDELGYGYGGDLCLLSTSGLLGFALALPIGVLLICNIVCFFLTVKQIYDVQKTQNVSQTDRSYTCSYIRLSTLTGIVWLFGYLALATEYRPLWYVFTVLNAGQGVLIFIAFIVTRRTFTICKDMRNKTNSPSSKSAYTASTRM